MIDDEIQSISITIYNIDNSSGVKLDFRVLYNEYLDKSVLNNSHSSGDNVFNL